MVDGGGRGVQLTVGSVTLGQVAFGSLRKDAEQPMGNKAGGAFSVAPVWIHALASLMTD